MTIADVLAAALSLFLTGLGLIALAHLVSTLVPRAAERARSEISTRPGTSFTWGLLALVLSLTLAAVLSKGAAGPLKLLSLGIVLASLTAAAVGSAGLFGHLASRVSAGRFSPLTRGALLVELSAAVPLVGWFVVLPGAFLVSLGAGVRSVVLRRAPTAVPALA